MFLCKLRWAATKERLQFTSFSSKLYLAPAPPPLPFWTGATFNPIANSIKTFPARTPSTSCKQCWNRSLLSIFSAWMFKSDQQISRKVQIDKNKWNMFFWNWNKLYRVWLSRGHMMQHLEVYLIFCACIYHPPLLYWRNSHQHWHWYVLIKNIPDICHFFYTSKKFGE